MVFPVRVIKGNSLSWSRAVDQYLSFAGIRVKSIEMGVAYLRLVHNGHQQAANDLLEDDDLMWMPWKIADYVKKFVKQPNFRFEVQIDRVVEAILRQQMLEIGNPFRVALSGVLKQAQPSDVQFRVYGGKNDGMWVSGFKAGEWSDPPPSRDLYAEILMNVTEDLYHRNFEDFGIIDSEFSELVNNDNLFQPSAPKSLLLISDSQSGYVSEIVGGTVVSISGGSYRHMPVALSSPEFVLSEYALIIVFCGSNCGLTGAYGVNQRNAEFFKLKDTLVRIATRRDKGTVLFCCGFDNGDLRDTAWHNKFVQTAFKNTGVKCIAFSDFSAENPFIRADGSKNFELFDTKGFHISKFGFDVLFGEFCKEMPRLRFVEYKTSTERNLRPKGQFEPREYLRSGRYAAVAGVASGCQPLPGTLNAWRVRDRSPLGNMRGKESPGPGQRSVFAQHGRSRPSQRSIRERSGSAERRQRSRSPRGRSGQRPMVADLRVTREFDKSTMTDERDCDDIPSEDDIILMEEDSRTETGDDPGTKEK